MGAPQMTVRMAPVRRSRRVVRMAPTGVVSLLDADPDLARDLTDLQRELARRRIRAELGSLQRGLWRIDDDRALDRARFGLLVIDGVLTRRVQLGRRSSAELLGTGDVLCPRGREDDLGATLGMRVSMRVLLPVQVALIGDDTLAALARLPAVFGERSPFSSPWRASLISTRASSCCSGTLPIAGEGARAVRWCSGSR
jgi:hypothetical protein